MRYPFLKGHGTENDFVLLPDHDGSVHGDLPAERVRALCDRRAGIGGDGVLRVIRTRSLVEPGETTEAPEWFMDYRNADGSLAEMCGNGIRLFARHLYDEGLVPDGPVRIGTRSGVKTVRREASLLTAELGPASYHGETKVTVGDRTWPATHVVVGNPHAVVLLDGDLAEAGSLTESPVYDEVVFPDGVNVEFVVRRGPGHVAMRVYERGVGETRSCGTGACAAAIASADQAGPGRWRVDVPGGSVEVGRDDAGAVSLTGPAVIVARGETDL